MKTTKRLLAGAVVASTLAMAGIAPVANAEVSASVGVSSSYLWRGFNLGSGTPAVSGSLDYSNEGFYAGIWASSGDDSAGSEYDLYLGYGGEVGDFTYDAMLINYVYPSGQFSETEGLGDFMEIIVSLGYGPVTFQYYDNIAGETGGYAFNEDYKYMTLSADFGAYSVLVGKHFEDAAVVADSVTGDSTHLDLSYAYNDNVSFTYSIPVGSDTGFQEKEPLFVVSYSMTIE